MCACVSVYILLFFSYWLSFFLLLGTSIEMYVVQLVFQKEILRRCTIFSLTFGQVHLWQNKTYFSSKYLMKMKKMKLKTSVSVVIHPRRVLLFPCKSKDSRKNLYAKHMLSSAQTNFVLCCRKISFIYTHKFTICKTICASFTSFIRSNKFQGVGCLWSECDVKWSSNTFNEIDRCLSQYRIFS